MPAGIEIQNDYGTVLIDDTKPALSLRSKIIVDMPSNAQGYFDINMANYETPCVAVDVSTNIVGFTHCTDFSGNTRRFFFNRPMGGGSFSFNVYIFDRPIDSGSNSGLKIYDASGRMTFDAMGKYGRISAVLGNNESYYKQAGRSYAVSFLTPREVTRRVVDPQNSTYRNVNIFRTMARDHGDRIAISDHQVSSFRYGPSNDSLFENIYGGPPRALVLDVTGY